VRLTHVVELSMLGAIDPAPVIMLESICAYVLLKFKTSS